MKGKQLLYVFGVLVVVVLVGVLLGRARARSWQGASAAGGSLVFPSFPLNDVARIDLVGKDGKTQIARKDGAWRVLDRFGYPAKFETVSEFLRDVSELKAAQTLTVGESQYGRLELLGPDKGAEAGTEVVFYGEGDKELARLVLGKNHERQAAETAPSNPMMGMMGGGRGGWPDGRYLLVPSAKKVVLVSKTFSSAAPKAQLKPNEKQSA